MRPPLRLSEPAELVGVLFDKDGTLLDFDATWGPATAEVLGALADGQSGAFADMAASAGFLPETLGFAPDSPIIAGDTDAFAPAWAERLGLAYDAAFAARVNALYRAASLRSLVAYDDVVPVLDTLRERGLAIGLATNDSEKTAHAHLEAMGIRDRFIFVCGYDSGFGAKPGPGMVVGFAEKLGVTPIEIALVGDSAHDIRAADAAGARHVGIARTPMAAKALEDVAEVTIESFDGLVEALERVEKDDIPARKAAEKAKAKEKEKEREKARR